LKKEKELQGKTIPQLMRDQDLTILYRRLKHQAEREKDQTTKLDPYTDEDKRTKKNKYFTIAWLEKNYMDKRNIGQPETEGSGLTTVSLTPKEHKLIMLLREA
jgi:hypothetical protein